MFKQLNLPAILLIMLCSAAACNNKDSKVSAPVTSKDSTMNKPDSVKTENADYTADGITMKGFIAYNETLNSLRPIVLIVPEWWGISDYTRSRATQLARMGYFAFAIDMYGEGKTAETPEEAEKLSAPFYGKTNIAIPRFRAAMDKAKTYLNADKSKIAAIGYCFGGTMVLNMARAGEPLLGVVSFHGNLPVYPTKKELLKADMLICHGEDDKFVSDAEVSAFKQQMDSLGAAYTFKTYPNATHAFTNPAATAKGIKYNIPVAYNAPADTASFNEMKTFLQRIFK